MADSGTSAPATVAVAVSQPDQVTVNVVATSSTKPEVSATVTEVKPEAKSATESTSATTQAPSTTEDVKPALKPSTQTESTKVTRTESKVDSSTEQKDGGKGVFERQPDDFYNSIFYFSGMGSVIGNALAEGVYVNEKNRKNAIDSEEQDGLKKKGQRPDELVLTARGQAQKLSTDFHQLQSLLDSLPIFTGSAASTGSAADKRQALDQPIHGELYFRCKERFPVQQTTTTSTSSVSRQDPSRSVGNEEERYIAVSQTRRRQQHDDAVLADVARAACDAFPLLPPARSPSRGGDSTPGSRRSREPEGTAVSAASPGPTRRGGERRRPAERSADGAGPGAGHEHGGSHMTDGVKSWQLSHVRQYDIVDGGLPHNRP